MNQETTGNPGPGATIVELWSLPMTIWTGWLTQWLSLLTPAASACAHTPVPDDDPDELHVPDPIEDDGEHALFA